MKKKVISAVVLLVISVLFAYADELYTDNTLFYVGENTFQFICDFEVPSKHIKYKMEDGKLTGKLNITAIMRNLDNDQTAKDEWSTKSYISQVEDITSSLSLLDRTSFFVSPGRYEFTLIVQDVFGKRKYTATDTIIPVSFDGYVYVSDILSGISATNDSSMIKFMRNGYTVIPNPSNTFTLVNPILYAYSEIYNLPEGEKYRVDYRVMRNENDTVLILSGKEKTAPGFSFVNLEGINTLGLKEGDYTLVMTLTADTTKLEKSTAFKKSAASMSQASKYKLNDEELKYYSKIEYIASDGEMNMYKSLDEKGKHNFLIDFWARRDKNPKNNKLDALDEYIEKIKYVDLHFSSGHEDGYSSARGRIYLKYGMPDEEMVFPSSRGDRPFESWIYYSNRGMQFIFMDMKGFGKYELLYTNMKDEDIPVNWESYFSTTDDIIQFYRD